jgi:NTE family protein
MAGAFFRRAEPESFSGGAKPVRRKIGVALGAGAARGWAHIGALHELQAMGVTPDIVVGSSIGAVVGGCFAAGHLETLEAFARSLTRRRVFGLLDVSFSGAGLIGGDRLRVRLEESIGGLRIENLPIHFAGVATEIGSGHEIWLKRGPLVEAMRASYALPGLFEPVRVAGRWLFDGAIVNPVPVSVARALGADRVIALNIAADGSGRGTAIQDLPLEETVETALAVGEAHAGVMSGLRRSAGLLRRQWATSEGPGAPGLASVMVNAFNITQDRIMRSRLAGDPPDALISVKVGKIGLFEFHRADELIALGREAVHKARDEIAEQLELTLPPAKS